VLGIDTASRVIDPRFYDDEPDNRDSALASIAEHGCRFLVAGRIDDDGFHELSSLDLPSESAGLFDAIPADVFRCDVSSTDIRNSATDG